MQSLLPNGSRKRTFFVVGSPPLMAPATNPKFPVARAKSNALLNDICFTLDQQKKYGSMYLKQTIDLLLEPLPVGEEDPDEEFVVGEAASRPTASQRWIPCRPCLPPWARRVDSAIGRGGRWDSWPPIP